MLAAVRRLNRGELVAETLRCALEDLALQGEGWLAGLVTSDWADRYGRPVRYDRLPRGGDALIAWVLRVGEDGPHILRAVYHDDAPPDLRELRSVQVLRQVWVQQYWHDEAGQLRRRAAKSTRDRASRRVTGQRNTGKTSADGRPDPASARVPWSTMEIVTPHDPEARYSQKVTAAGQRDWIGYRDHQTETCDETSPNVIIQVLTRPAPQQDIDALDDIHHQLTRQGFQPLEHVVDGGYVTPDSIHQATLTWGIPLLGPVRDDPQAAQRPGFTKEDFHINAHGLRHCRYRGLAKTHVQHVLTAAGTNIVRLSDCFPIGTTPASLLRPPSHFKRAQRS